MPHHQLVPRMVELVGMLYQRLAQGLSNAIHRQSTITDPAKQECLEPNIAADGAIIKREPKAKQVLVVVGSVAIRVKRASPSEMTKVSVDSVRIGFVPRNIADLVVVPRQGREAARVTDV